MTTTTGTATDTVEYATAIELDNVNAMAADGWHLHSVLLGPASLIFVMVRGDDADLREQRDAERRRADRFAAQLATVSEERGRLAGQVRRVRDLCREQLDAVEDSGGTVQDLLPVSTVLAALGGEARPTPPLGAYFSRTRIAGDQQ